ncbi:MAG: nucleoside-diphosphate kinase [Myxococcales bacterium]|nr:nucleoside-diphosphate kinase [Myxococcales bacterium]
MAIERTFGIIKPDAVASGSTGGILSMVEGAGFKLLSLRMTRMSVHEAEGFYAVHKARPFFKDLIGFMTSGPCVLMALEGEDAIARYRQLMGPTDAAKAPEGTIRHKFGTNIERNAVHGSDGPDTAQFELGWFFRGSDLGLQG